MSSPNFIPSAFLLDVDRTLTNSHAKVSPKTREVISQLKKKHLVSVCTGRSFPAIKNYILPLFDSNALHIVDGGGHIIQTTGKVIWGQKIEGQLVKKISLKIEELGGQYGFAQGDTFYTNKNLLEKIEKHPWEIKVDLAKNLENWQTSLLIVYYLNDDIRKYIYSLDGLNPKEMTSNEGFPYFDITIKGVNKATAAKIWAKEQNIDLNKVIAIGDSENDIEVMRVVGRSVAMGNAVDEVKKIAHEVIGDTDSDGLAKYLEQFTKTPTRF